MKPNRGLFITFEGGEGAGKSTLIRRIYSDLEARGIPVVKTYEPGGTSLGHNLRQLLLEKEDIHIARRAELFLFLADRAQHVEEILLPSLRENKVVLCDRFTDSTIAYQGVPRANDQEEIRNLCTFATEDLLPDLTFLLDIDPQIGLKRTKKIAKVFDRMEQEKLSFHIKVREAFLKLAEEDQERFYTIDATMSPDEVFNLAIHEVNTKLNQFSCCE